MSITGSALWEDPAFPASDTSVGLTDSPPASWRRFHALFPDAVLPPDIPPGDVRQGALGSCWLLAPVAALASRHPKLLASLFVDTSRMAQGRVTLQTWGGAGWQHVEIDTLLPCDQDGNALFSHGWAALVEKAAAKRCGSFAGLEGGRSVEAFVDLTGGFAKRYSLGEYDDAAATTRITHWISQGALLCASASGREETHTVAVTAAGRRAGQHFVTIRDTASDGALGMTELATAHFLHTFDRLSVGWLAEGRQRQVRHQVEMDGLPGGPPMTSAWCTNHQHLIRSPQRCRVHLLLSQSSHAEYLGLSVLSAASVQPVVDCTTEQLLAEAGPERARQLVCEFVAEAGCRYLVVPHSVRARASGIFILRVLSEAPVSMQTLPPINHVDVNGGWEAHTAGGRFPSDIWGSNPQFAVCAPAGGQVRCVLSALNGKDAIGEAAVADARVGLRVLRASESGGEPCGEDQGSSDEGCTGGGASLLLLSGLAGGPATATHPRALGSDYCCQLERQQRSTLDAEAAKTAALATQDLTTRAGPPRHERPAPPTSRYQKALVAIARARRALRSPPRMTVAEAGFVSASEGTVLFEAAAGEALLLVPSTQMAGQHGAFRLQLYSSTPLTVRRLADGHHALVRGAWTATSAGGCRVERTWQSNPQYCLELIPPVDQIRITLSRASTANTRARPSNALKPFLRRCDRAESRPNRTMGARMTTRSSMVDSMVGFYVLRCCSSETPAPLDLAQEGKVSAAGVWEVLHEARPAPPLPDPFLPPGPLPCRACRHHSPRTRERAAYFDYQWQCQHPLLDTGSAWCQPPLPRA